MSFLITVQPLDEDIFRALGLAYQIVRALHGYTPTSNVHFVINPVSYVDGHKYRGIRAGHRGLMDLLWRAVSRHGICSFYEVKYHSESENQHE